MTSTKHGLDGMKVAFLVSQGFEQDELSQPRNALVDAGADTDIVCSSDESRVTAWRGREWGWEFPVDVPLARANPEGYDALIVPGGVMSPDSLRTKDAALHFVRHFAERSKPLAAICHGPWVLIDAGVARDRKLTSYPSLRSDLVNAGAEWVDAEVVVDGNLITSRRPDDLSAFIDAVTRVLAGSARRPSKQYKHSTGPARRRGHEAEGAS